MDWYFEEINLFNYRSYWELFSPRLKKQVFLNGIPASDGALWIGCRGEDGTVAGCIIGGVVGPHHYQVNHLMVRESYRRRGCGTALVRDFLAHIPDECCEVTLTHTLEFDQDRDVFCDFAEAMHFESSIYNVFFLFDPSILIDYGSKHEANGFRIEPLSGSLANDEQLKERHEHSLNGVEKYGPFADFLASDMRKLRNNVVLPPTGDTWRLVEEATGTEAGWFSCASCDGKYYVQSLLYIHPEYRHVRNLWLKTLVFAAKKAQEANLVLGEQVFYWRSSSIRGCLRFGKRFGLTHYRKTFYFRLKKSPIIQSNE